MKKTPDYFPMVDFLRGLGALVVLVWHYHFFYSTGSGLSPEIGPPPTWTRDIQPLYDSLWIFYHHGRWAVQFFWVLSGFVFAHVYIGKATKFRDFFILRFSRLYPLHLITLLTITALQFFSEQLFGRPQVFAINDVYHFFLHLFFASNWGFEKGYSFNMPVWSISVEEIAYWVFWIAVARYGKLPIFKAFALMLMAIALRKIDTHNQILSCFMYFFSGAFTYKVFRACHNWKQCAAIATAVIAASVISIGFGFIKISSAVIFLFSGMLLAAAAIDQSGHLKKFDRTGLFIGSLTYSIYMWHLPMQVFILIIFDAFALDRSLFNHPVALLGFLGLMTIISHLSYIKIERPLQSMIRKKYLGTPRVPQPTFSVNPARISTQQEPIRTTLQGANDSF